MRAQHHSPKGLLLLLLLCCAAPLALAQESNFTAAHSAYQQGHPEEAVSLYESMQRGGAEDAALYYNLGNAYAAQGRLGKAILSYVRALRLEPGAEDVRANLMIVRRAAAETAEPPRVGPLPAGPEDELGGTKTPAQLGWLAFSLYAASCAFAAAALIARQRKRAALSQLSFGLFVLVMVGAASFAFLSWRRSAALSGDARAVVLADNTPVRRGPIETAESLYALPEGEILSLEERRDNWGLVRAEGHPEGWVPLSLVEPVLR